MAYLAALSRFNVEEEIKACGNWNVMLDWSYKLSHTGNQH